MYSSNRSKLRPFFLEQLPPSVRTTLLKDTASFLLVKSLASGVNYDYGDSNNGAAMLVEVKQVLHPICSTVRHVDITDTSITNVGLQQLCKKIHILNSIGEYSVSDSFLRSLCVVSSMKIDKFPLVTLHTRKVSYTGMYNLVRCTPSPWSAPSHAGSLCLTSGTWPTCPTSSR